MSTSPEPRLDSEVKDEPGSTLKGAIIVVGVILTLGFIAVASVVNYFNSSSASPKQMREALTAILPEGALIVDQHYFEGSCFDSCAGGSMEAEIPQTTFESFCTHLDDAARRYGNIDSFWCEHSPGQKIAIYWDNGYNVDINLLENAPKRNLDRNVDKRVKGEDEGDYTQPDSYKFVQFRLEAATR